MSQAEIAVLLHGALITAVKLGGPLLAASLAIGLIMSVVQAVTQINEPSLAFVPKLLAMAATLVLLGPFMVASLEAYARLLFDRIVAIGAP